MCWVPLSMAVHPCNPSTQEAEARGPEVIDLPQLHKSESSLGCVSPCLKKTRGVEKSLTTDSPGTTSIIHLDSLPGSTLYILTGCLQGHTKE